MARKKTWNTQCEIPDKPMSVTHSLSTTDDTASGITFADLENRLLTYIQERRAADAKVFAGMKADHRHNNPRCLTTEALQRATKLSQPMISMLTSRKRPLSFKIADQFCAAAGITVTELMHTREAEPLREFPADLAASYLDRIEETLLYLVRLHADKETKTRALVYAGAILENTDLLRTLLGLEKEGSKGVWEGNSESLDDGGTGTAPP